MDDGPDTGYSMTDDRTDEATSAEDEYWRHRGRLWQHGPTDVRDLDYYVMAPLHQLEEWNEESIFEGRNQAVSHGELGVMVTMEFRALTPIFNSLTGELQSLEPLGNWEQLCAVYGDDDNMCRLTIFSDGESRRTNEYIDQPIRR